LSTQSSILTQKNDISLDWVKISMAQRSEPFNQPHLRSEVLTGLTPQWGEGFIGKRLIVLSHWFTLIYKLVILLTHEPSGQKQSTI